MSIWLRTSHVFDKSRYEVKPLDPERIPKIFSQRGIADETVISLAPFISLIRDTRNENFDGYNIGFPYTEACDSTVNGYEIRGMGGYKSKAAGQIHRQRRGSLTSPEATTDL